MRDVETQRIQRFGFFTTRWVNAETDQMASDKAWQAVLAELAEKGHCSTPDQLISPINVKSVKLSWLEGLLHLRDGRGFTFYAEGGNEAV